MFHSIMDFFYSTAFHIFGADTSWAEVFGFISGGLAVYFCAVAKVANFPVGIINAVFFFILFTDAKLFADAYLQLGYVVLNAAGWYIWLKRGPNADTRPVMTANWKTLGLVLIGIGVFTVLFRPVLESHDDPYPLLDALTTGISIGAQVLLSLKYIQNWYFWIVADLIYIPLYIAKGLVLTSGVYILFLGLCFLGLFAWRKIRRNQGVPLPTEHDSFVEQPVVVPA